MFSQFFCPFPAQSFIEFHLPQFCPSFFLFFFFPYTFFFSFHCVPLLPFVPLLYSPPISPMHTLLPPALAVTTALAITATPATHSHRWPTYLQALPSLATTNYHHHSHCGHRRPPLPPIATTIAIAAVVDLHYHPLPPPYFFPSFLVFKFL